MSVQRRRGRIARVYALTEQYDRRGNKVLAPDFAVWTDVKAAIVPERSSRAEVPGQQEINVVKMIVAGETPDVHLWGVVEFDGKRWDIAAPPAYHHGSRRTRHYSAILRQRPEVIP